MPLPDSIPGFAKVSSGWTGVVSVTIGAAVATVTPDVDSPASVWLALLKECRLVHGGVWNGWVDTSGILTIQHSVSFTLASSLSTKSRCTLATSATGTTVTGTGPHQYGFYPLAINFTGHDRAKEDGVSAADGSGATPLIWGSGKGDLEILDTWVNNYNLHESLMDSTELFTMDFWMGGRGFGRYIVESAIMTKPGILADYAMLKVGLAGVAS